MRARFSSPGAPVSIIACVFAVRVLGELLLDGSCVGPLRWV